MPVLSRQGATPAALLALILAGCLLVGCVLAGCAAPTAAPGGDTATNADALVVAAPDDAGAAVALAAGETGRLDVGGRPVAVHVPRTYDPAHPVPLLVLLHGFTGDAARVDRQLGLGHGADARGVLYAVPEGTLDADDHRFWNASDACCGRDRGDVDDVAYLELVIRTLSATYAVDTDRVAVVGYSNGGFMAYRLGCDGAGVVSVVVSVSGAMPADAGACRPPRPVTVIQAHGTADPVILYAGGTRDSRAYPSAHESAADWARIDGCTDGPRTEAGPRDLDLAIDGAETTVEAWSGCADGSRVELWSIAGAEHLPTFGHGFAESVLDTVVGRP